jgi:hypothetical protein
MSGQLPDAFPSMRSCLEYPLYALHINLNPTVGEIWLRRHDDAHSLRAAQHEFKYSTVINTLRVRDDRLCLIVKRLYKRTIDFGGHPNERAVTGSMEITESEGGLQFQQIYLHQDSLSLDHGVKTTAQVGLGSLCIFRFLFKERFEILGLQPVIDRLRARL